MNKNLSLLQPYPFEKLAELKKNLSPPEELEHIPLSMGEPKHAPPSFVLDTLVQHLDKFSAYPLTKGLPELRQAIVQWADKRFHLQSQGLDWEQQVLPVSGTREALFSFTQAVVNSSNLNSSDLTKPAPINKGKPLVLCPNPCYQIYEGATLLAGAQPYFLLCNEGNQYSPDYEQVPEAIWQQCQLLFLCTPGNPTGRVQGLATLQQLIALADQYDFVIASDECYSELYFSEQSPPPGLLQACAAMGRKDYARCVVFHSLSKRSNLPGLRSGFVAGDAKLLSQFLKYRTYHGATLPIPNQFASIAAWKDEEHVLTNRQLYRAKFDAVLTILEGVMDVQRPDASFYLWPKVDISDTKFAQGLFAQQHVSVLPGSFLSRETNSLNPGFQHLRMALVAPIEQCVEAAERIRKFMGS